jgi:Flp pilus assembly protein TadD
MAAGRIHPRYVADAVRALGLALLAHRQFEAAVRQLRTARSLQPMLPVTPDLVRALNGLAIEQARSGHLAEAARALEEALALMPGSPEVRDNLIAVREALHR